MQSAPYLLLRILKENSQQPPSIIGFEYIDIAVAAILLHTSDPLPHSLRFIELTQNARLIILW